MSEGTTSTGRIRRSGRTDRMARRAAGPTVDPCPPGAPGGRYRPLRSMEVERIVAAALELLATLGMGEAPDRLRADLLRAGAREAGDRVLLPEALVREAIAAAPRRIALHGRAPGRDVVLGGDAVHFGTGGAAVQALDLDTGLYRPSTLRDLRDFTRLQDALPHISWFTRCCIATDLEGPWALDAHTAHALLRHTTKPVATAFTLEEHVAPIAAALDIAAGGDFAARPFLKAHVSPVISPMRYGEDAVDVVYACIRHGIPLSCITAAQSGATAPATLAGFLVQSLAETLASLAMVHAIRPGFPMVFSNWPLVIDLRSGAFAGGGGEIAVLNAASAQISNALGLVSGVAASMTDAKAVDAQAGAEKALTALAAGLAGGNLVYESAGMTASLLGASFEAFVLDDDMLAGVLRVLRGIEVTDATLDLAPIRAAVLGEGHFLGAPETLAAMERDYHYPALADRDAPSAWAEAGAPDAWSRAKARARHLLATHHPEGLTPAQDRAVRAALAIP
ncbi:trimethylamine methyltransferase family protein [Jannaschia sp. W003]|uniref:trimethylamine methyltransferase family protein n=1 Tax=Jannaschia sp. W003 TaxID=2867012 RepID=UPI0021A4D445|nr:trimethylamine methyltransferase family protein [Jannaschia sp. W003]UWQ22235.1 trimethylamine methyltransferase family protein [Jannaschia sp. W003]